MMSVDFWVSLITLAAMEVVLGIDNLVFLAILLAKVPADKRESIRKVGLGLALGARVGLLFSLQWMMSMTRPLFHIGSHGLSLRDLILVGGGLFLMGKSAKEIHDKVERDEDEYEGTDDAHRKRFSVVGTILQIIVVDLIFSLDSVVTAVGMARDIRAMVIAMLVAVSIMGFFSKAVGEFVEAHPSIKLLALSFLTLIGMMLLSEGFGQHFDKGYIYFSMAFSLLVELLSMRYRKKKAYRESMVPNPPKVDPREGPSRD
jgi:predicted tellurium resistance membrane protein TerC